ncbi:MAG: hypothetical protein SOW08_06945 [Lachnospiraceae bacterium]|nr:hypothetical protein [Lachnospiraceae bacterium]
MEKHKSKWKIAVGAIVVVVGIIAILFASGVICIHKWEDATCTVPQTCSKCGKTKGNALGHKWGDPTCLEPKTCSVCGETEGEALGHKYGEWKITKEATCSEEGEREKACTVCGWKNYESIPKLEHTYGKWKVTKKATCTEEGTQEKTCSACGDVQTESIPKVDHTPGDWEVTKEATATSEGEKSKKCKVCGEVLETKEYTLSPEQIEKQYKEKCDTYSYNTIARDPDKYKGKYAKFTGEVIQSMEDGDEYTLRVNVTEGRYGYDDTILVSYTLKDGESRILEDDIVTMYGMLFGTYTYETIFGASVTVPLFFAEYVDVH